MLFNSYFNFFYLFCEIYLYYNQLNMKQATDPKMPELDSSMTNNSPIEEKEFVYFKAFNGVRMLFQKKKDFLLSILENKSDMLDQ